MDTITTSILVRIPSGTVMVWIFDSKKGSLEYAFILTV